jgi:hypothetical protein
MIQLASELAKTGVAAAKISDNTKSERIAD